MQAATHNPSTRAKATQALTKQSKPTKGKGSASAAARSASPDVMDVDAVSEAESVKTPIKKEPASPCRTKGQKKSKGANAWVPPVADVTPKVVIPMNNDRPSAAVLEVTGLAWKDYQGMNVSGIRQLQST